MNSDKKDLELNSTINEKEEVIDYSLEITQSVSKEFIEIVIKKAIIDYKNGNIKTSPINAILSQLHLSSDARIIRQRLLEEGIEL